MGSKGRSRALGGKGERRGRPRWRDLRDRTKVVGGGVKLVNELFLGLVDSYPTTSGWAGRVLNANNSSTGTFLTTAICAKATSSSGSPPSS